MNYNFLLLAGTLLFLTSCNDTAEITQNKDLNSSELIDNEISEKGFSVLEKNCFSCHNADPSSKDNIASTMKEVKESFYLNYSTEKEFSSALSSYVNHPSQELSKVENAFEKFGVMPTMEFTSDELNAVGYYLFHSDIDSEQWFSEVYPKEKEMFLSKSTVDDKSYIEKGREYAMATKSVLGKNLMGRIKSKGTDDALSFCNSNAVPLVDSMSTLQNVHIKRVSDKNRNENNAANEMELAYIQKAKENLLNGGKIKPQVQEVNGRMIGYYPILTNNMCMQCHGDPQKQIQTSTLELIQEFYPNDKAFGYGEGELRGIWVVDMEK